LIEGKHTKTDNLPSEGDIKDGLLKMILLTNLKDVQVRRIKYNPIPVLKLTTGSGFRIELSNTEQQRKLDDLKRESKTNGFKVLLNSQYL